MRVQRLGRVVALVVVGLGFCAIVVLAVVTVITRDPSASVARPRAAVSSVCKQVTPAVPDFDAPPFAFDPIQRASAFMRSIVSGELRLAYGMLSDEHVSSIRACTSISLELFGSALTRGRPASVDMDPGQPISFGPSDDMLRVPLRVTLHPTEDNPTPDASRYVTVRLLRDGRVGAYQLDEARSKHGPVEAFAVPPYVDLTTFEETSAVLGEAPWSVDATITTPRGSGPFPAVVLVQGLHASDRDATGGASKWFRDLAWGLASRGIATLRYDQRTWTHALAFARQTDFTLAQVSVDDALAAVRVLRQTPRIDPARVYALGHLSGAFAAPRVAARDPALAGLILIWPFPGTPMQYEARLARGLEQAGEDVRGQEQASIEHFQTRSAGVAALMAGESGTPDMSVRPGFHRDIAQYRLEDLVRDLDRPVLLLHGARNTLLEAEDVLTWFDLTEVRTGVAIRGYQDYTLGVIDWHRRPQDDTYGQGHVAGEAIEDIAAWIGGRWPRQYCNGDTWLVGCQSI